MRTPVPATWTLEALQGLEITPYIAYRGEAPDWACDMTILPPFTTWWEVEAGAVEVHLNGGVWKAAPGQWILLPQGIARRQILHPGTRLTSLSVRAAWPNGRPLFAHDVPHVAPALTSPGREARRVCAWNQRLTGGHDRNLRQHRISLRDWFRFQAELLAFLDRLWAALDADGAGRAAVSWGHPVLDELLGRLRRQPRMGALNYSAWRKEFGLSRTSLDRLAQRHLGTTLRAQRDSFLRQELQRRLIDPPVRAKELAAAYGFQDPAHFSRWVRRHLGNSPRNIRQQFL